MEDETSPLLKKDSSSSTNLTSPEETPEVSRDPEQSVTDARDADEEPASAANIYTIIPVLLLGMFYKMDVHLLVISLLEI